MSFTHICMQHQRLTSCDCSQGRWTAKVTQVTEQGEYLSAASVLASTPSAHYKILCQDLLSSNYWSIFEHLVANDGAANILQPSIEDVASFPTGAAIGCHNQEHAASAVLQTQDPR